MQQQIIIAAALLYNAPHNTQASCASALVGQMPALPPTNLHAALSGRGALLFALLCAHHDAMLAARFVAQRHSRADHLPQHEFRARLQAQVHRLLVRAHCLLLPARQQTSHTTNGLLTHGSHHPPHPSPCSASPPGRLKSPAAAPPLRGACRRVHASGTRKHPETHGLSGW